MKTKRSIVVEQYANPKFGKPNEPEVVYQVKQAINTLQVKIGDIITPDKVEQLISAAVQVTIRGK